MRRLFGPSVIGLLLAAGPAAASVHPVQDAGFDAGKAYELGQLDHVGLLSGNLTVTLPLGISYPLSESFSYQFQLVYNTKCFDFDQFSDTAFMYNRAFPSIRGNAGLCWTFTLGRLFAPNSPPINDTDYWMYLSPSGSQHLLFATLHDDDDLPDAHWYSRDGSYLRLRLGTGGAPHRLEHPDGTVRQFAAATGRLERIYDRFASGTPPQPLNWVAINYATVGEWNISDSVGRSHKVKYQSHGHLGQVITEVHLSQFGDAQGADRAIYELAYLHRNVKRPYPDLPGPPDGGGPGWEGWDDGTSEYVNVPLLVEVRLPDGTGTDRSVFSMKQGSQPAYHLDYQDGTVARLFPGFLQRLTLPTLGRIQWTYQAHGFPTEPGDDEPPGPGPPVPVAKLWRVQTGGIASRQLFDRNGASLGQWTYQTALPSFGGNPPLRPEKITTVLGPQGKTEHFFTVIKDETNPVYKPYHFGLPFTSDPAKKHGSWFLSTRLYDTADTLVRSTYVTYEHDTVLFALLDFEGYTHRNQRLSGQLTRFHDDPVAGAPRQAWETFSDWDGYGHYRSSTTGGNFGAGDARTRTVQYNPDRGTYGQGSFSPWPAGDPWVLETYTFEQVTETGASGQTTSRRQTCFEADTGYLQRVRTIRSGTSQGASDLLLARTRSSAGNTLTEGFYGGDLANPGVGTGSDVCTVSAGALGYQIDHTYQHGVRSTSQYSGAGFKFLDRTIDEATGKVSKVRDTAGIETTFAYDELGRLTNVTPNHSTPSLRDAETTYTYTRAEGPGADEAATLVISAQIPGAPNRDDQLTFDGLGRVVEEARYVPRPGSEQWVARRTTYNAAGWRSSVSEWGEPDHVTLYEDYDPFGRVGKVTGPEADQTTFTYRGVRQVERTVKVALAATGQTAVTTTERYDRQGRLSAVVEPSGASGANVTTSYRYDVGGRLAEVSTPVQVRTFVYDNRGFLLSEDHPEKDGPVTYGGYDARGNVGRKVDNGVDLRYFYDSAGRLTQISRPANATACAGTNPGVGCRKNFVYGTSGTANGKLLKAIRHHAHPGIPQTRVDETYEYAGRMGRASKRTTAFFINHQHNTTFHLGYTYTPLGDAHTISYPECGSLGGPTVSHSYSRGFLTAVPGYVSSIRYHSNGLFDQIVHINGVVEHQRIRSGMARPFNLWTTGGSAQWASGRYLYDGAGNIRRIGESRFTYDQVSRLKRAEIADDGSGGGLIFRDGFETGNTSAWSGSGSGVATYFQEYTYQPSGSLTNVEGSHGGRNLNTSEATNRLTDTQYAYDARGQLVTHADSTYHYDEFGLMQEYEVIVNRDVVMRLLVYTADDERLLVYHAQADPISQWTIRGLDNKALRQCRFQNDTQLHYLERDYVYRNGQLLAAGVPGGRLHYHLDHLGSPRLITNQAGAKVAYHAYFPYGDELPVSQPSDERMRFTAHERDFIAPQSLGVDKDYMHAREYKPWLGRFLSTDPKRGSSRPRSPQSFNRYSYGLGNPLKMVDPDGKEALTFTITTHIQAPKVFAPVPGFPPHLQAFAGGTKTSQTFTMETSAAKASNPIVSRGSSIGPTTRISVLGSREIDSAVASSKGVVLGGGRDSSGNAHAFAGVVSGNPLHATAPPIILGLLISAPEGGSSFTIMGGFGGYPSLDITATNEAGQSISVYQSTENLKAWGPFDLFPLVADQTIQLQCDFVMGCGDLARE